MEKKEDFSKILFSYYDCFKSYGLLVFWRLSHHLITYLFVTLTPPMHHFLGTTKYPLIIWCHSPSPLETKQYHHMNQLHQCIHLHISKNSLQCLKNSIVAILLHMTGTQIWFGTLKFQFRLGNYFLKWYKHMLNILSWLKTYTYSYIYEFFLNTIQLMSSFWHEKYSK